jgi:hypothetical protein
MNADPNSRGGSLAYAVALVGALLIVYALVKLMQQYTRPLPVNQARIEERRKALGEQRAADADALNAYGFVDQSKGIVRLPITNAMELTLKEYKNPAAARSNLVALSDKVSAPPPKAPEAPNPFE